MCRILLLVLFCLAIAPALVQAAPDAGAQLQQIEHDQQQTLPRKKAPELLLPPPEIKPPSGLSINVREFRFIGNTLLSAKQLAPAVASFSNRSLDFNGLNKAAIAVANTYREAGWIVRAYLPEQDFVDGVITIQIVEAVFGGTHFKDEIPPRMSREQILHIFEAQQKIGEPFNADKLDRALLLADDLPGVTVAGSLREGAKERETDIDLKLGDEPFFAGEAGIDNTGSRSTGSNRLTTNINLNSPFKHGDLISANFIHTQGSDYLRLDGSIPVGSNGWRTGINASHLSYNLVAPEFTALNACGTSDTFGLESTFPVIRSRLKNLYLNVNLDQKSFDNNSSGATTTNYKASTLSLGFDGNLFDNIYGGGANSASLSLVDGVLNLDGSPNQFNPDGSLNTTAGRYEKLHYSASRQQAINETVAVYGALSGQVARKNLDSSEKFYLGGANGVRAYPSNEGGGSEGKLINLELRVRLPEGFTFTEFYDYGHIVSNPNGGVLNEYSLKGLGMSLAWQSTKGPSIKAVVAHRLGDNPNPTATGNDQDGSLDKNRLWITASFPLSGMVNSLSSAATSSVDKLVSETASNVTEPPKTDSVQPKKEDIPASTPAPQIEAKAALPSNSVSSQTTKVIAAIQPADVSVVLDRQATPQKNGLLKVTVASDLHNFSFPLPAEVATDKEIRLHGGHAGKWVPYWLKFNQRTKIFTASAVPKGALPAQVILTLGGLNTTLVISERAQ